VQPNVPRAVFSLLTCCSQSSVWCFAVCRRSFHSRPLVPVFLGVLCSALFRCRGGAGARVPLSRLLACKVTLLPGSGPAPTSHFISALNVTQPQLAEFLLTNDMTG
jgi:hypothetical protein